MRNAVKITGVFLNLDLDNQDLGKVHQFQKAREMYQTCGILL